ncbi:MAG: hypothetical protein J4215_01295 [Candidatus Diapherotrites archaeon]|uniref:Class III signal peptide-containing protein n=1 Tax=Candidatus Iainarchaeum sp. TaxID=3101447 RepID=A0A8T4L8W0_9ARCH|nr:hypothetical protein [Candidatus Diapherotrites archaeon]
MNQNGQLSIEFMLILIVSIVYINTVIFPMVDFGQTTLNEIYGLGQTRMATQKIVNTINSVVLQSSTSKQIISMTLPKNSRIECVTAPQNGIKFTYTLSDIAQSCSVSTTCTRTIPVELPPGVSLNCAGLDFTGPRQNTVTIRFQADTVQFS